ncbi:hypothetical protein SBRY_60306 [Actinacidiphila bryophytorum]|uniref:Uncharacterized protein n=1 Tax=Actinacidiphila bryophytorum TaxID=1436133 RepID=A0A9W4MGA5_9ACTN|nr:hypothetical protein SBRY_60306 [Actinacidiphila bryophytorum]
MTSTASKGARGASSSAWRSSSRARSWSVTPPRRSPTRSALRAWGVSGAPPSAHSRQASPCPPSSPAPPPGRGRPEVTATCRGVACFRCAVIGRAVPRAPQKRSPCGKRAPAQGRGELRDKPARRGGREGAAGGRAGRPGEGGAAEGWCRADSAPPPSVTRRQGPPEAPGSATVAASCSWPVGPKPSGPGPRPGTIAGTAERRCRATPSDRLRAAGAERRPYVPASAGVRAGRDAGRRRTAGGAARGDRRVVGAHARPWRGSGRGPAQRPARRGRDRAPPAQHRARRRTPGAERGPGGDRRRGLAHHGRDGRGGPGAVAGRQPRGAQERGPAGLRRGRLLVGGRGGHQRDRHRADHRRTAPGAFGRALRAHPPRLDLCGLAAARPAGRPAAGCGGRQRACGDCAPGDAVAGVGGGAGRGGRAPLAALGGGGAAAFGGGAAAGRDRRAGAGGGPQRLDGRGDGPGAGRAGRAAGVGGGGAGVGALAGAVPLRASAGRLADPGGRPGAAAGGEPGGGGREPAGRLDGDGVGSRGQLVAGAQPAPCGAAVRAGAAPVGAYGGGAGGRPVRGPEPYGDGTGGVVAVAQEPGGGAGAPAVSFLRGGGGRAAAARTAAGPAAAFGGARGAGEPQARLTCTPPAAAVRAPLRVGA